MSRNVRIDLRATSEQKHVLRAAAKLNATSVTDYVLKAALTQAQDVLLDQRVFILEPQRFDAFVEEVTNTTDAHERLEKVLSITKPWEKW